MTSDRYRFMMLSAVDGLRRPAAGGRTARVPYVESIGRAAMALVRPAEAGGVSKGGMDSKLRAAAACVQAGCVPELYQACGTEDFLYSMNLAVRDWLLGKGAKLTYAEGPGGHDWSFWDHRIQEILDWFLQHRKKADSAVIMG